MNQVAEHNDMLADMHLVRCLYAEGKKRLGLNRVWSFYRVSLYGLGVWECICRHFCMYKIYTHSQKCQELAMFRKQRIFSVGLKARTGCMDTGKNPVL